MISHKHRFIFVHIGRTGGTSVERALAKYTSYEVDDFDRLSFRFKHQHILDLMAQQKSGDCSNLDFGRRGSKKWMNDYFKFTFVRNPWDRCVSRWRMINKIHGMKRKGHDYTGTTFKDYITNKNNIYEKLELGLCPWKLRENDSPALTKLFKEKAPYENQIDWIIGKNRKVLTDFVGKFENLQRDFDNICDRIGVEREELELSKASSRSHYRNYYDKYTRDFVARKYVRDIQHFGYSF